MESNSARANARARDQKQCINGRCIKLELAERARPAPVRIAGDIDHGSEREMK